MFPESARNQECSGTLPVTGSIMQYLRDQGFEGFAPDTHLVAMPHIMPDLIDWITAIITLGIKPENIHLLGKQYSQVDVTRDKLKGLGVNVMDYTPAGVGRYYETLESIDLPKLWSYSMDRIEAALNTNGPQNVIVMDDGGKLLRSIPQQLLNNQKIRIVGVEQTTNGFNLVCEEGHSVDIIIPAKAALKLECEAPFIAEAAIRKLREKLGIFRNRDVAVIGIGNIGGSVATTLADNHNSVFVYDVALKIENGNIVDPENILPQYINIYQAPEAGVPKSEARLLRKSVPASNQNYYICRTLVQAVQSTNYVFGCTGRDIFKDVDLDNMGFQGPGKSVDETRFISISSGDKEFLSLLKWVSKQPKFLHHGPQEKAGSRWDVTTEYNGSRIRVVQQGFPINFDGKTGSGTPEEMQLISSFLMASIVQGAIYMHKYPVRSASEESHLIMLSPEVQRRILFTWLDKVPNVRGIYDPERIEQIRQDPEWFAQRSYGEFCPVFENDFPTPECIAERVMPVQPNQKWVRNA